jgi:hypothetical protein
MYSSDGLVSRLIARVKAIRARDWRGKAGDYFRRTTQNISEIAEEHDLTPREVLGEGIELGRRKLEGLAQHEFSEVVKNYADTEKARIEAELLRRGLQSDSRKKEADARKADAEARLAELSVVNAELELLTKLQNAKVILHRDSNGNLTALPLPPAINLLEAADPRKSERKEREPQTVRKPDGIHITLDWTGPVTFLDEKVVVDSGVTVNGEIRCRHAEVHGSVKGDVYATERLEIFKGGRLEGDVTATRISLQEGAYFKGKTDIKNLSQIAPSQ